MLVQGIPHYGGKIPQKKSRPKAAIYLDVLQKILINDAQNCEQVYERFKPF